jgi:hypothetical protein
VEHLETPLSFSPPLSLPHDATPSNPLNSPKPLSPLEMRIHNILRKQEERRVTAYHQLETQINQIRKKIEPLNEANDSLTENERPEEVVDSPSYRANSALFTYITVPLIRPPDFFVFVFVFVFVFGFVFVFVFVFVSFLFCFRFCFRFCFVFVFVLTFGFLFCFVSFCSVFLFFLFFVFCC